MLMRSRAGVLAVVVLSLVACQGDEAAVETTVPPDLGPSEVVNEVLVAVTEGRFEDAALVTDQAQAGLMVLAEGAELGEVVTSLDEDAAAVAANFWSGFAQSLDPEFDPADASLEEDEPVERGGVTYVPVALRADGDSRTFYLRRDDRWKVDLMATFAPFVAERLTPRVESLLTSANPDADAVLGLLSSSVPSLEVAAANTSMEITTHQSLLALIERITRSS